LDHLRVPPLSDDRLARKLTIAGSGGMPALSAIWQILLASKAD